VELCCQYAAPWTIQAKPGKLDSSNSTPAPPMKLPASLLLLLFVFVGLGFAQELAASLHPQGQVEISKQGAAWEPFAAPREMMVGDAVRTGAAGECTLIWQEVEYEISPNSEIRLGVTGPVAVQGKITPRQGLMGLIRRWFYQSQSFTSTRISEPKTIPQVDATSDTPTPQP